jgi:glycosyltransferase involved in cell wall biosynthesis
MAPTTTFLVSTYNRPDALDLVLRSALAQAALPGEVLVADDGSRGETAALVRDFACHFAARGVPVTHVWQEDVGFRKARVLNAALARATGEYVVQVDGDLVLHPAFVRSHVRFARRGSFVQGSRVLLRPERTAEALARGETRFSLLDPGLKNRANALHLPWLSALVPTRQDHLRGTRGVNFAFWRDDALRVNGWNEAFEGWGREDSEFAARLLNAGLRRRKLKFAAVGYHLWHPELPRDAVPEQERALRAVVAGRVVRCAHGVDAHLRAPAERPA